MNNLILLLLTFVSITTNAQTVFNLKRDMVWVPNANLYVCKYEVTNIEYREFTNDLLSDSLDNISRQTIINSYYPDTMVWINQFQHGMGDPMNKYYRWYPAFNGYPVVGVTYEGALKYCEWLTNKYGKGEYKFRLPTKNEFILYAKVGSFNIAGGIESPRNDQRKYLLNYKPNVTNLDDSISQVFYNPKNNTYVRKFIDTTNHKDENLVLRPYTYYVENYLNGYLYLGLYKDFLKIKAPDSITFYVEETNSYVKEKLVLHTKPNYYNDGYMYTSPSRATRDDIGLMGLEYETTNINYYTSIVHNKSSYPSDKNGLYDLAGNVSEMIAENGISMGGNWDSEITELNYNYVFKYDKPDVLVGFRIVAERLK